MNDPTVDERSAIDRAVRPAVKWYVPGAPLPPPWADADFGPAPRSRRRPAPARIDHGLSVTLQIVLWLAGAFALGDALASFRCWLLVRGSGFERDAVEANASLLHDWTSADGAAEVFWCFFVLVWVVALILLMVWMAELHRLSLTIDAGPREWTSGWVAGGWFIPIANLFIPKLVLNEIETVIHGRTASSPASRTDRTLTVGWVWWLLLVAAVVSMVIAFALGDGEHNPTEPSALYLALAVSMATWAVSCAAGAFYVRQLTRLANVAAAR